MKDLSSSEAIQEELSNLEHSLEANRWKQERLAKTADHALQHGASKAEQLGRLELRVDLLALEQDLLKWGNGFASISSEDDLESDINRCLGLGQVLCRHPPKFSDSSLYEELCTAFFQQEYLPLHHYARARVTALLRRALERVGYPSEEGCQAIISQCQGYQQHPTSDESTVAWCCDFLTRIQIGHIQLCALIDSNESRNIRSDVVVELCRPLLDRLRFHFVQTAPDRITSSRIDRLPEWLFNYVREHVFEGGPWELVIDGVAPIVAGVSSTENTTVQFLCEIVHLTQSVLTERNFFRQDAVAGVESNPHMLCSAIEQLLSFDSYVRELFPESNGHCPGLTNMNVGTDEELWQWWLGRETDWILSTLFQTSLEQTRTTLLSPRSELFCALMQSVRSKSRVLSSSFASTYIARVAVPACMEFLDAIHASSRDLTLLLVQRDSDLESNATCWMELINGTHLASLVLAPSSLLPERHESDNDFSRVGRSMERLRDVLVEEFVTSFVETVLMERAKLASYLMRCPHLLSTATVVPEDPSLSADLHDVVSMLSKVVHVCNANLQTIATTEIDSDQVPENGQDVLLFAPSAVLDTLSNMVPEKFLEVALDAHGMTPDLMLGGAIQFCQDSNRVIEVFGKTPQKACLRLLEVSRLMTMPCEWLHSLRQALLGLVQFQSGLSGNQAILKYQQFSSDTTLFEEAKSMIEAKGFTLLELEDVLSILNRRKDSFL